MGVHDFTLYDVIRRNAQLRPLEDAVVFKDRRLTHAGFKDRCDRLAAGLVKLGLEPGDRIGVVAQNSDEFLVIYGAAAKIGAVVLPVNWRLQPGEIAFVLCDGAPKTIIVDPEFQQVTGDALRDTDFVRSLFVMDGGEPAEGFERLDSLYVEEGKDREFDVSAEAGLVIIHTAAVEGRPRGALLSHRCLVSGNVMMMRMFGLGPDDAHLCFIPLFHIAGLGLTLAVMHAGGKNVIQEKLEAEATLDLLRRERGTIFFDFAPILKTLLDRYDQGGGDLSSLKAVVGLDSPDTVQRFQATAPHARFWSLFAQTEALCVSSGPYNERPGSAGRPYTMARVALFDDYDNPVPTGSPGEICVRSPNVFSGYWGLEEETDHTFRNGWHHTGDIGRFDEDGYLFYVKRKAQKELIKPGGENVYPSEVEKVLLTHELIAETSVIGVPDEDWGEAIKAICVLEPGARLDPAAVTEYVASKIARYKKPKHVVFVDRLPKTAEGEIDREQVKKDHGGLY
jgi:acyl-CoA synthetase (AMP-forming)/AMP-acid ligase II